MTTTGTETHTGQERERVGEREKRRKIRRGREGKNLSIHTVYIL